MIKNDYPDQRMCPNCVTPWKCNGPHELPETGAVPSETPLSMSMFATQADYWKADADKQRHIAANAENMAAMYKAERDEARAECERLRQQCQAEIASRSEAAARTIAAETREREAYERAAKVCEKVAAEPSSLWEEPGCWSHAASNCAIHCRALADERRSDG